MSESVFVYLPACVMGQMDVMCHVTGLIGPERELARSVSFALSECGGQISGGFCGTLYNTQTAGPVTCHV